MKELKLDDKEIRLIIGLLEYRQQSNETQRMKLSRGTGKVNIIADIEREMKTIEQLISYLTCTLNNEDKEEDKDSAFVIKMKLDVSEFEKELKAFGERLLGIYGDEAVQEDIYIEEQLKEFKRTNNVL